MTVGGEGWAQPCLQDSLRFPRSPGYAIDLERQRPQFRRGIPSGYKGQPSAIGSQRTGRRCRYLVYLDQGLRLAGPVSAGPEQSSAVLSEQDVAAIGTPNRIKVEPLAKGQTG